MDPAANTEVEANLTPNAQEYRAQILARSIKDLLGEGIRVRWVHSAAQLADALAKIMESHYLRNIFKNGVYKIHDAQQILKSRADQRTRAKWLKLESSDPNMNSVV